MILFLMVVSLIYLVCMLNADLCKSLMRANSYDSDSHSSEDDVAGRHLQLRTFEDEENKLLKSSQQSGAKKRRIILNIRVVMH
jgi:hypothetical protein